MWVWRGREGEQSKGRGEEREGREREKRRGGMEGRKEREKRRGGKRGKKGERKGGKKKKEYKLAFVSYIHVTASSP